MPEQGKLEREAEREYYPVKKPMVDEYMLTEWEERIYLAMEFNYTVSFKTWDDGVISIVVISSMIRRGSTLLILIRDLSV
ncbi:YolD-like family protein [Cytobacillus sp. Hm23]